MVKELLMKLTDKYTLSELCYLLDLEWDDVSTSIIFDVVEDNYDTCLELLKD